MIKLQDILSEAGLKRFKVYVSGEKEPLILLGKNEKDVKQTAHTMIQNSSVKIRKVVKEGLNEYGAKTSELEGTSKGPFGRIYQMKDEMAKGEFDPKNPQIYIQGFGVWTLKTLEKSIARDLKDCISKGAEYAANAIYRRHSTIEAKIKAANDVYKQMNTSQYKRAVTMYKNKRR